MNEITAERFNELETIEMVLLTDDFTGDKTLMFTKLAGKENEYLKLYNSPMDFYFLGFSFKSINKNLYISFKATSPEISLAKNDSIILLFEDQSKIEYVFTRRPSGQKGYYHNSCSLTSDQIKMFFEKVFLKLKITNSKKGVFSIYSIDYNIENDKQYSNSKNTLLKHWKPQYNTPNEGKLLIKLMILKFVKEFISHNSDSELSLMRL